MWDRSICLYETKRLLVVRLPTTLSKNSMLGAVENHMVSLYIASKSLRQRDNTLTGTDTASAPQESYQLDWYKSTKIVIKYQLFAFNQNSSHNN